MTECIKVDKKYRIYIQQTNKKYIDELKMKKVSKKSVRNRKKIGRM